MIQLASCTRYDLPTGASSSVVTLLKNLLCRLGGPVHKKSITMTPLSSASFSHRRRESQTRGLPEISMISSVSSGMLHSVVNWLYSKLSVSRAVHSSNVVGSTELIWLSSNERLISVPAIKCKSGTTVSWFVIKLSTSRAVFLNAVELTTLMELKSRWRSRSWVYWQNSQSSNAVIWLSRRWSSVTVVGISVGTTLSPSESLSMLLQWQFSMQRHTTTTMITPDHRYGDILPLVWMLHIVESDTALTFAVACKLAEPVAIQPQASATVHWTTGRKKQLLITPIS